MGTSSRFSLGRALAFSNELACHVIHDWQSVAARSVPDLAGRNITECGVSMKLDCHMAADINLGNSRKRGRQKRRPSGQL
jgi:hypothetical protein